MEEKFAGVVVRINSIIIAKVTNIVSPNLTISEAEITGSEDIVDGGDILAQKFASIAVNEVATVEGICIRGNSGQAAVAEAARQGATVEIEWEGPSGYGAILEGFFQSYQETGSTTDVFKFTSTFRVNENSPHTPAS